jgi:hypothetical protein
MRLPAARPGPEAHRPIYLASWHQEFVAARPEPLLRGLSHSDGCRIIATERKRDNIRRAPRYGFSNHSEDILEIFKTTCDAIGVHTTRASWKQIAVYSKAAVARLDEFIGPKA